MALISRIKLNIADKLKKDEGYRNRFFLGQAQDEIASKIKELRELRDIKQIELAHKSGMKQSAISRIEQADYSSWTFKTLIKVAESLEARLKVTFEPSEDVIEHYRKLEETIEQPDYVSISPDQQDESEERPMEPLKTIETANASWKNTDAVSVIQANQ